MNCVPHLVYTIQQYTMRMTKPGQPRLESLKKNPPRVHSFHGTVKSVSMCQYSNAIETLNTKAALWMKYSNYGRCRFHVEILCGMRDWSTRNNKAFVQCTNIGFVGVMCLLACIYVIWWWWGCILESIMEVELMIRRVGLKRPCDKYLVQSMTSIEQYIYIYSNMWRC